MSYLNFEEAKAKIKCPKARQIFVKNIANNGWENYTFNNEIIDVFSDDSLEAIHRQDYWHITVPRGRRF